MNNALAQKQREENAEVTSEIIYKGKILEICLETLTYKDAKPHHWEIVRHPGAVVILAVDASDHLYLIKQWRRPIGKIILELPAGTLDAKETPLQCAQREIQEEIGYRAGDWTSLGGFYSAPGFCDEYLHLFLATDLTKSALARDENEGIDLVKLPLEEALTLIDKQEINDVKTLYAILAYARMKKRQQ